MDRLRSFEIFKAVVEHGSFTKASHALGLLPAIVTRSVQDLEAFLGVRLLNRTSRRIGLTSAGGDVLARATQLLATYDELTRVSSLSVSEPRGTVRLTAPDFYARHHLGAALAAYAARHPQVSIDLRLRDSSLDRLDDDVDLALCLDRQLRSSFIARHLAVAPMALCASPAYLARWGVPSEPADLIAHHCLTWARGCHCGTWNFRHVASPEHHAFSPSGGLHSTHAEVLVGAAVHGAGIILVPKFMIDDRVALGELQPLLPAWRTPPLSIHLVYRSCRLQPLSVRRLIEHLVQSLGVRNDTLRRPSSGCAPAVPERSPPRCMTRGTESDTALA